MKPLLPLAVVLLSAAAVPAQPLSPDPSVPQLLGEVIAQLPADPFTIDGEIIVRRRRGLVVKELGFEMAAHWGAEPAVVRYTLRDAFGRDLERLTVSRREGNPPDFQYASGPELTPTALPDLSAPVHGTDFAWLDLTLDFLWWPGGSLVGTEEIRGRPCFIVDVPAPQRADAVDGYAKARLWIDEKLRMLLQAEGYGADGHVRRRLWIKSFKKIDETWMIKDMEVQAYPAVHRTKLRVREVSVQ